MEQNRQHFYELSLEYVCKLQETQERKKFEFVEPVSINSRFLCESHVVIENRNLFLSRSHLRLLQAVMHKHDTNVVNCTQCAQVAVESESPHWVAVLGPVCTAVE